MGVHLRVDLSGELKCPIVTMPIRMFHVDHVAQPKTVHATYTSNQGDGKSKLFLAGFGRIWQDVTKVGTSRLHGQVDVLLCALGGLAEHVTSGL
jgi:hypothetical protein